MHQRIRMVLRFCLRACFVVAFAFLGLVLVRGVTRASVAYAGSDVYAPSYCLGGWINAKQASGASEIPEGASAGAYTIGNSAFLAPDVSAQIFCGYFPVESRKRPPVSAKIIFRWSFAAVPAAPAPVDALPPVPTETTDGVVHGDPSAPDSSGTIDASSPEVEPPATVPALDPVPPAPVTDTPTSFLWGVLGSIVHAQEQAALDSDDFFDVRYSFDGTHWTSAGQVNADNWDGFSITVPATSWEQLQNLQITIDTISTLSPRPRVYLESMELQTESDRTTTEVVADSAQAVGDAIGMVVAAADAVSGAISDFVASDTPAEAPQVAAVADAAPAVSMPSVAPVLDHVLEFSVNGSAIPAQSRLPWQEKEAQEAVASTTLASPPHVTVADGGRSFTVSGSCAKSYAVIITYRHAEDYLTNPRSSLGNVATPCTGGHFTYDLSQLPETTLGGAYYLLIGEEGETGTWTPVSALLPITISSVEVAP